MENLFTDEETNLVDEISLEPNYRLEGTRNKIYIMEKKGFTIIYTDSKHILLDLDTPEAFQCYIDMFPQIQQFLKITEKYRYHSKSGVGWHVVLELEDDMPVMDRITLQALLGSDLKREWLSWDTIRRGLETEEKFISILFQPPNSTIMMDIPA